HGGEIERFPVAYDQIRPHGLAPLRVRHADDRGIEDRRVHHQHALDLGWIYIDSTTDNDIAQAAAKVQENIIVEIAEVARAIPKPAEGIGGIVGAVAIANEQRRIGAPYFADDIREARRSGGVGYHELHIAECLSHRIGLAKLVDRAQHRHAVRLRRSVIIVELAGDLFEYALLRG